MPKIKLFFLSFLLLNPFWVFAQFVEEERETPSDFSLEGLKAFSTITDTINIFLALLFITSILGFVFAGIKFVIAGGSEDTLGSARKTLLASTVGFILSLVGYVVINVIKHFIS